MNHAPPKKVLGVFSIVMINVIAVDSLRSLPFSAEYGFSLVFFYCIALLTFFLPIALVSAELATGWPNKGGVYIWVREAFGDLWGFLIIWLQWVYNVVWYPTILSFIAGVIAYLINPHLAENKYYMLSLIVVIFWLSTLINLFGMRLSSWVSTVGALIGTLIPMIYIIILGIIWLAEGHPIQIHFTVAAFIPHIASVKNLAFLTAVLFGLVGMEMSAVHADEVKGPGRAYPRAIALSTIIIFLSLVFASLAIAIVVPQHKLNVVTGLVQAFQVFFDNYHLAWMSPVMTILIIIGGVSGVATWIIGPTKGLLVAVRDGSAPEIFSVTNKHDVPIFILLLQAIIFTILCSVFLLMPTVSSSYWVLTAMTAQLAMLVYVAMFVAAIYLRYKKPDVVRAYKIPVGNLGIWVIGLLGLLSSISVIVLGFFPPAQIQIGALARYETILIVGILTLSMPPLLIYRFRATKHA